MSDYGVFEASSTDGHEEEQQQRQAQRDLGRAIEAAREGFGGFLGAATDKDDYKDRLALVMNDLMQKVADSGVMPVPGVMRKVKAALRPEFRKQAAPGFDPNISDENLLAGLQIAEVLNHDGSNQAKVDELRAEVDARGLTPLKTSRKTALKWRDTDFNSWVKVDRGAWSIEVEEVGGDFWVYFNGGPADGHMEQLSASSMEEAKAEAESIASSNGITASRKQANSSAEGFLLHLKDQGFTMPKDAGRPGEGGEMDDELYDYFGGDQSKISEVSQFLNDNWSTYAYGKRKQAYSVGDEVSLDKGYKGFFYEEPGILGIGVEGPDGSHYAALSDALSNVTFEELIADANTLINDDKNASRKQALSDSDYISIAQSIVVSGLGLPRARGLKMADGRYSVAAGDKDLYIKPTGRGGGYDWTVEPAGGGQPLREGWGMTSAEIIEDLRGSSLAYRKQAEDYVKGDALNFINHLQNGGYRMPKDAGYPGEGGQMDDELYDYTNGDQNRISALTRFLQENWDYYAYGASRKQAFSEQLGVHLTDVFESVEAGGGWRPITGERLDWMKGDLEFYGGSGFFNDWSLGEDGEQEVLSFDTSDDAVVIDAAWAAIDYAAGILGSRKQASDVNTEDQDVLQFFYQFEDEGLDVSASGDEQWEWLKSNIDYDTLQDAIDQANEYGEVSRSNIDSMAYELQQNFFGSRKQASDASYEGWTARIIYDEDDFEYAETTTPSGEQADSIYPMDGSHFESGELREALEELAREWGDDAYSGTYQYNSSRKTASKCPKCDGMGRETYETDTGSLSTQTCTACGGTGQAKEAARKTAAVTWYDQSDQFGGMWSTYQGSAPDSPNGQISESNGTYRWYVSDSGTRGNQQTGESSSLDEAKREAESALASLGITASRRTAKACGGTGTAKESRRKTALDIDGSWEEELPGIGYASCTPKAGGGFELYMWSDSKQSEALDIVPSSEEARRIWQEWRGSDTPPAGNAFNTDDNYFLGHVKHAGGTDFATFSQGSSAQEAFNNARAEAKQMYGDDGYTGSIAEKDSFEMASRTPMTEEEAKKFIWGGDGFGKFDDKWGPAGCIELDTGGFVFFGIAST